jgi:hypothetical protein
MRPLLEIFAVTDRQPEHARGVFSRLPTLIRLVRPEGVDIYELADIEPMHVARRDGGVEQPSAVN